MLSKFKKLDFPDKIGCIFCFSILSICLICLGIFIYYIMFYQVNISPFDNVIIAKCSDCENLIIKKNSECKTYTCKWSAPCETFKYYKYLAKVITPQDKEYEMFKLKYDFYNVCNGNFNKFYEWYKLNKNKKFYKYIKPYIEIEDRPVYKTKYRSITRRVGLTLTTQRMPYSVIIGYKQVPIQKEDVRYINPNDQKYKKEECDIFEYYAHVIVRTWKVQ